MTAFSNSPASGFQEIDHTADWAYQVWGKSLAELFTHAAQGLYALVGVELATEPRVVRTIHLTGVDSESLLVAWLNELIHLHESENLGFDQIEILRLDGAALQAEVRGAPTQQWLKDIKAATYHNLVIHSTEKGFEATLVLDV
ncbi:MAG: archease [Leptolyngbyaceae cyanobacterium MO_188.B28]|nr:archease [Leptolyngbyaceae cyanobacterium MO_188.B28]